MRILHTSDWHLGRRLYGKERRSEYEHFLDWLLGVVSSEHADSLIVSGDVFDSPTPPVWAQELYYSFLTRLRQTPCRSAVITAGNHDSAALLDAPAGLLGCLSVRVVGAPRSPQDSVFELPDSSGDAAALCCAVPFLRRRDLVTPACGQTADDILCQYGEAFRAHYAAVVSEALSRRGARDIPVIATGHCFVSGGTVGADGELTVGSLDAVPLSAFPDAIDYLALGHLHTPQQCGDSAHYCGSALCMNFAEAEKPRHVLRVDCGGGVRVTPLEVPRWQKLARVSGTFDAVAAQLTELETRGESVWVEVRCTEEGNGTLFTRLQECLNADSPVQILSVQAAEPQTARFTGGGDLTEDWSPLEVFRLYLQEHSIEGEEASALTDLYVQALEAVLSGEAEE